MNLNRKLIKQLSDAAKDQIPKNVYTADLWIDQYNLLYAQEILNKVYEICEQGAETQTTSQGAITVIKMLFESNNETDNENV